ncbi:Gfo/Idh/MocA family oxidoreductase [Luteococcus sp. H138]|uniref:Gfo/Idh/MocA family protein n=1 Tax=unclassified Luteococcus TaxID=2639923 RepID=UPI00313CF9BD
MTTPVRYAIAGAGSRGRSYANWIRQHPDRALLLAIADPTTSAAQSIALDHRLRDDSIFGSWQEMVQSQPDVNAVIVCTQDNDHVAPAIAFLRAGYDVLLEKPMAPTEPECHKITQAAEASGTIFSVCHVMRHTPLTAAIKRMLIEGRVGQIMSVEHLEPVGWWHHAHSYVRGNWCQQESSSSMLLAKSCHDLDWLLYIVGQPLAKVSSFGTLSHFTKQNQPAEAADRCLDCPLQDSCAYSATRIYLTKARLGAFDWPLDVITHDLTLAGVHQALREGPYGRCVYSCDNDVVDHQVVAMEFMGGATAVFTMTAFTEKALRKTRIFGTLGRLETDGEEIKILDFRTGRETVTPVGFGEQIGASQGHAGGDDGLMDSFTTAVAERDQSLVSDASSALASHLAVFAAERSRLTGTVIDLVDGQSQ